MSNEPVRLTDPDDPRIKPGAKIEKRFRMTLTRDGFGNGPSDVRRWMSGQAIYLIAEAPEDES